MIWASLMNGDMLLLKINSETFNLDLMNQVKIDEPGKKIYSLTRLSDGRMCVSQDKGFTIWQINSQQNFTPSSTGNNLDEGEDS
jgi:hypothetical protein